MRRQLTEDVATRHKAYPSKRFFNPTVLVNAFLAHRLLVISTGSPLQCPELAYSSRSALVNQDRAYQTRCFIMIDSLQR